MIEDCPLSSTRRLPQSMSTHCDADRVNPSRTKSPVSFTVTFGFGTGPSIRMRGQYVSVPAFGTSTTPGVTPGAVPKSNGNVAGNVRPAPPAEPDSAADANSG